MWPRTLPSFVRLSGGRRIQRLDATEVDGQAGGGGGRQAQRIRQRRSMLDVVGRGLSVANGPSSKASRVRVANTVSASVFLTPRNAKPSDAFSVTLRRGARIGITVEVEAGKPWREMMFCTWVARSAGLGKRVVKIASSKAATLSVGGRAEQRAEVSCRGRDWRADPSDSHGIRCVKARCTPLPKKRCSASKSQARCARWAASSLDRHRLGCHPGSVRKLFRSAPTRRPTRAVSVTATLTRRARDVGLKRHELALVPGIASLGLQSPSQRHWVPLQRDGVEARNTNCRAASTMADSWP